MRRNAGFECFINPQMCQLVHKGDQKGIFIQVMVDADAVVGISPRRPVIAQFRAPAPGYPEMNLMFNDSIVHLVHSHFR